MNGLAFLLRTDVLVAGASATSAFKHVHQREFMTSVNDQQPNGEKGDSRGRSIGPAARNNRKTTYGKPCFPRRENTHPFSPSPDKKLGNKQMPYFMQEAIQESSKIRR